MPTTYQPFLIGDGKFSTGLFDYLQPWVSPGDSFRSMVNANVYRGTVNKRGGMSFLGEINYTDFLVSGNGGKAYTPTIADHPVVAGSVTITAGGQTLTDTGMGTFTGGTGTNTINYTTGALVLNFTSNVTNGTPIYANFVLSSGRPIMGMFVWTDETTGEGDLVIYDTRRAAVFDNTSQTFIPINTISETFTTTDAVTSYTFTTGFLNLVPFTVTVSDGSNTMTDNGSGGFPGSGNMLNTSTVVYSTGVITLNITTGGANVTYTVTASLAGDYFTGDSSNFFNFVNWLGDLYATNNVDRITLYDGTNLSRPPFPITLAHKTAFVNDIETTQDLDVYKNRLLVERPTLVDSPSNVVFGQSIRWSAINNPTNLVADITGNGGELSAATDDFIQACKLLRDQIVCFFANSVWIFKFTGSDFNPFIFQKINSTKNTTAPYACIEYDERITSMGNKGLIACDGVNVQRYDVSIIDAFLNDIRQSRFKQCFGIRYDSSNQSYMLYPNNNIFSGVTTSNSALVYNFLENTWSTYRYPYTTSDLSRLPSVMGIYRITNDLTWASYAADQPLGIQYPDWQSADFSWDSNVTNTSAPNLLMGAQTGIVYQLDVGTEENGGTDYGTPIESTVQSIRLNPFANIGQKVQVGYIDFYYNVEFETSILTLTFSVNNSLNTQTTRLLTLDGPQGADTAMKRVYVNLIGEFIQMQIQSIAIGEVGHPDYVAPGDFKILGIVIWAEPAGRFTP